MKKNLMKKTMTMLLAFAMVFTMMPVLGAQTAYADTATANGGTVASNSAANATSAFGSDNVSAGYSAKTLTITLNADISLKEPIVFTKGATGDKVVLDLNGHSITGGSGTDGTDEAAAKGMDAIRIIPAEYDVEVRGPGSVTGGKGAVYKNDIDLKSGCRGGDAVSFSAQNNGSYWNPQANDAELAYGLIVTGGAALTGGDGADITGDDWIDNIRDYSGTMGYAISQNPQFILNAGAGGAGIGQAGAGVPYGATTLAYAKIVIDNGTVNGGSGGIVDMGSENTPLMTHYALMNNTDIDSYMQGVNEHYGDNKEYDNFVANRIKLDPGNGGDGIMIGAGRKHLFVKQGSTVTGGGCGTVEYGRSKLINNIGNDGANGGSGISVYGDIGLKNVDTVLTESNWSSKNEESGDMGIYIAGTVKGGDTPNADAMKEDAGDAGSGILLNGDSEYAPAAMIPQGEDAVNWGIIEVAPTGTVLGGNGGLAVHGSGGAGGEGIWEAYTKSSEPVAGVSKIGTNFYVIRGTVTGGTGGDSMISTGSSGAEGISFGNYRMDARLFGDGTVTGGNGGEGVDRNGDGLAPDAATGIRFYPANPESYNNSVASTITQNAGQRVKRKVVNNGGLIVSASMSPFNDYPSTNTRLNCTINLPSGYSGDVYVLWTAEIKLQSNPSEKCDIEPSGSSATDFKMLSDADYKYLSYPDGYLNGYNLGLSTTDRITETISHNNSYAEISCVVQLDDGRWAKSNVMHFTKEGWSGSGGDQPGDPEADRQAAERVVDMIWSLPSLSALTLSDEGQVRAARAAYEALTDQQKILLANTYPSALGDLAEAEARILDLKGEDAIKQEAVRAREMIMALPDASDVTDADNIGIVAAYDAYRDLSDSQKTKYLSGYDYEGKLDAAWEALMAITGNNDQEKAEIIRSYLADLPADPDELTLENEAAIKAAKAAYNTLADKTVIYENELEALDSALAVINGLKAEAAEAQLNALDVSAITEDTFAENEDIVRAASDAYKALSESEKALVSQGAKDKLTEAETVVKDIVDTSAANAAEQAISNLPPKDALTLADEALVEAVAEKYNGLTDDQKALVSGEMVQKLREAQERIASLKEEQVQPSPSGGDTPGGGSKPSVTPAAPKEIVDLPAVKISKPKAAKKKVTVKWSKVSKKNQKKIQGIEIRVVGPGYNKTFTASKKKTSKTIKGLKSKKKYTVSVRAYKWVGNTKHVSKWKSKKVKIK